MSDEKSGFIIVEAKSASLASLASGVSLPKNLESIQVCTVEEQDIIFEIKRDEKNSIKIALVEGKNDNNDNVEDEKAPEEAVARINTKYYTTLQNAINEVSTDNTQTTIVVLKDISENVSVSENRNIVIDLNNKTLKNTEEKPVITLDGNSNLTINKGNVIGNNYKAEVATILVKANTTLNLSNTNVQRTSTSSEWEAIELHGNLNVDSGEIKNSNSNCICTYDSKSQVQLVNVTIIGETYLPLSFSNATTFTIEGGVIQSPSNALQSMGKGTIKATRIVSSGVLANRGELYLEDVYIKTSINNAIYNVEGAKLEINGESEIIGEKPDYPTIYNLGELTINGGTITHTQEDCYAVYNKGGTVNINGGTISSKYGC